MRFRNALTLFDRAVDFRLPPMRLGHDAGNGAAVAGNHNGLPRSTSSRSWGRWVLASEAWISRTAEAHD